MVDLDGPVERSPALSFSVSTIVSILFKISKTLKP
jgi:hypothetical protein